MATAPVFRQYSNRRRKKSMDTAGESAKSTASSEKEKRKSPTQTIFSTVHIKDSHTITPSDISKRSSISSPKPQIIVRKFDLPVSQMSPQSIPLRDFSQDFQKPKQRWKQLCNLTQEMSTTLPVTKVKMVHPSTPLTRELRPGTLQSNVNKVDITALHKLLNGSKISADNVVSGDKNPILFSTKTVKVYPATTEKEKLAVSSISSNKILVSSAITTAQPHASCVAVSPITVSNRVSPPSSGTSLPLNTNVVPSTALQTFVSNSPTSKIIVSSVNQPQASYKAVSPINVMNKVSSASNVIFTSPNSNIIPSSIIQTIVPSSTVQTIVSASPTNKILVSGANQLQTSYKTLSPSSSNILTSSGTNIELPSARIETPISPSLSNNVIMSNASHPVTGKLVDSSSVVNNTVVTSTAMSNIIDTPNEMENHVINNNASEEMLEGADDVPEAAVTTEVSTDGCGFKFEPKHSNIGVVGGRYVILQQLPGNKFSIQEADTNNKSKVSTIILQSAQSSNLENRSASKESSYSEPDGSLLKATLLGTNCAKDQNIAAVNPITHEDSNSKSVQSPAKDTLTKPIQNNIVSPVEQNKNITKQVDNIETSADSNGDSTKKPLNLKQLQHEIALMKARQSIALQVEREVLRAKDVKIVREVQFPARKVLLSDIGSQTNLFSLVEPGRMVEMMINPNRTSATAGMVGCKGNLGPGENSSGMQSEHAQPVAVSKSALAAADKKLNVMLKSPSEDIAQSDDGNVHLEEPDKKRPRLDQSFASGAIADVRTIVSDISVDSGMDISREEHRNTVLSKNINLLTLNSNSVQKSSIQSKGHLGHQQIIQKALKQRVEDSTPKSVFDIIVQHNIATQAKLPMTGRGSVPMVYIPENSSFVSVKNNSNALKNVNNDPMLPLPQNVNIQETAAKISELKRQAFEDWSRCLSADGNGNIPLHKAVLCENLTLIKRQCVVLYARKASLDVPNNEKKTPLHLAVDYGNAAIVRLLLSFGAQPSVKDCDGNTSLHLAVVDGNYECLEALLNCSNLSSLPLDDFNDEGYAPMHLCALRGKVEETRLLLSKGADVNLKDARSGRTPLFHAVEADSGELVQLLLAADANTNEPNFAGHTPLTAASEISFSTRPNMKENVIADGMNFSSKLVSLRSGEDIGQILEDGSNIVIRGEIVEDINMDEESEVGGAQCYNNISSNVSSNNIWTPNV